MNVRHATPAALAQFQRNHPEVAVGVPGGTWLVRETRRSGEPLVLLPGAQGTADIFYRTAELLGTDFRVITATPPALADCAAQAESLAALLDALGLGRVHLLGSSLSGHVVQWFAQRHADRIATLFLVGTFCDAAPYQAVMPSAEALAATPAPRLLGGMLAKVLAAPEQEPADGELKEVLRELMEARQGAETLHTRLLALRLARPVPPVPLPAGRVVLIDDDADPVIPPAMRTQLRERYAACEHHAIDGGGHYPHVLRPERFAAVLRERLRHA